ncbi:hypothetical protein V8C86DRAFT_3036023, partial [Haematococcus lacustris]
MLRYLTPLAILLITFLAQHSTAQPATGLPLWCGYPGFTVGQTHGADALSCAVATACSTVDQYWTNFAGSSSATPLNCLLPGPLPRIAPGVNPTNFGTYDLCGATFTQTPLSTAAGAVYGSIKTFVDYQNVLYVTVAIDSGPGGSQLYYEFPSPYGSFAASLYVWYNVSSLVTDQYQYPVILTPGKYTCITFRVPLRTACDPLTSTFNPITTVGNAGCLCRPGVASCPPVDISQFPSLFMSLKINGAEYSVTGTSCGTLATNPTLVGNYNVFGFLSQLQLPSCAARPPGPPPSTPPAGPPTTAFFSVITVTSPTRGVAFNSTDCNKAISMLFQPFIADRAYTFACTTTQSSVLQSGVQATTYSITWTLYFTLASDVSYFYLSAANQLWWLSLFQSNIGVSAGCGATGSYTDSVTTPSPSVPNPYTVASDSTTPARHVVLAGATPSPPCNIFITLTAGPQARTSYRFEQCSIFAGQLSSIYLQPPLGSSSPINVIYPFTCIGNSSSTMVTSARFVSAAEASQALANFGNSLFAGLLLNVYVPASAPDSQCGSSIVADASTCGLGVVSFSSANLMNVVCPGTSPSPSPPSPPPSPPPFVSTMLITVNSPTLFGPTACAAVVPVFM